jgi:hypothetical protein
VVLGIELRFERESRAQDLRDQRAPAGRNVGERATRRRERVARPLHVRIRGRHVGDVAFKRERVRARVPAHPHAEQRRHAIGEVGGQHAGGVAQ